MARRVLPWRQVALAAVALLSAGVITTLVWSDRRAPPRGPAAPCPAGFINQVGRADAIRARLRTRDEGRALLEALGETEVRFCFGHTDVPALAEGRVLVLDADWDGPSQAARVGHLLDHVVHGSPFPDTVGAGTDCERVVRDALTTEARAYALELRLRRALGVEEIRYPFEADANQSDNPLALVERYLVTHPDGGPGLDALGTGYRLRCERAREVAREQ